MNTRMNTRKEKHGLFFSGWTIGQVSAARGFFNRLIAEDDERTNKEVALFKALHSLSSVTVYDPPTGVLSTSKYLKVLLDDQSPNYKATNIARLYELYLFVRSGEPEPPPPVPVPQPPEPEKKTAMYGSLEHGDTFQFVGGELLKLYPKTLIRWKKGFILYDDLGVKPDLIYALISESVRGTEVYVVEPTAWKVVS